MTRQEEVDALNLAQSKLSGEEFNLGDLIKILETAPQDMLIVCRLSCGKITYPHSTYTYASTVKKSDDQKCFGSCLHSWLDACMITAEADNFDCFFGIGHGYKVKDILEDSKKIVGMYLLGYGGWSLMELSTPIYLEKNANDYLDDPIITFSEATDYPKEKVVGAKIENGIFHLICRDSSND